MSKKIKSRKWLNSTKHGGTAFIAYEIEHSTHGSNCWADLKIADCNRIITLDFNFDNTEEFEHSIAKLDLLREELSTFRTKLIAAKEAKK